MKDEGEVKDDDDGGEGGKEGAGGGVRLNRKR